MDNQYNTLTNKENHLYIATPIKIMLVRIPEGEFILGSDPAVDEHGNRRKEQPQHLIYLDEFFIAKYPVTVSQYEFFIKSTGFPSVRSWLNGMPPVGKENHPVTDIAWEDAEPFVSWLRVKSDQPFRLPTEAEWEKTARGTDGRIFPWGNEWDPERFGGEYLWAGETTPVGFSSPHCDSPYGAADMCGNTFEYCSSEYKDYPYIADDGREDQSIKNRKVIRSGPSNTERWWDVLRSAVRHSAATDKPGKLCGFRVALSGP